MQIYISGKKVTRNPHKECNTLWLMQQGHLQGKTRFRKENSCRYGYFEMTLGSLEGHNWPSKIQPGRRWENSCPGLVVCPGLHSEFLTRIGSQHQGVKSGSKYLQIKTTPQAAVQGQALHPSGCLCASSAINRTQ